MGHNHSFEKNSRLLNVAIFINVVLTVVQFAGGILSGSLSLMADALHNLSDAGSLFIALIARKIGNQPANNNLSYGYKRAEILGALINSTTLIIVGVYLCYEAVLRYFNPEPIDGWIVVIVAGVALVIDIGTAVLTYLAGGKENLNLRAAFIHNVSDALASIVVIIAGSLILLYQYYVIDLVATVGISAYVIYHGVGLMKKSIRILMQAVPGNISLDLVRQKVMAIEGVKDAQHIHLWQLDDKKIFFEGHIVVTEKANSSIVKNQIRNELVEHFQINHSTIEIKWEK